MRVMVRLKPHLYPPLAGSHPGHQGLPVRVGLVSTGGSQGSADQRGHALMLRLRTIACVIGRLCRCGLVCLLLPHGREREMQPTATACAQGFTIDPPSSSVHSNQAWRRAASVCGTWRRPNLDTRRRPSVVPSSARGGRPTPPSAARTWPAAGRPLCRWWRCLEVWALGIGAGGVQSLYSLSLLTLLTLFPAI